MKDVKVLDSWALLAYFEGEKAGMKVKEILKETGREKRLLLSAIQFGEILYVIEGRHGKEKKEEVRHLIEQMPIEVIDADKEAASQAAHLKAAKKLPYGDSFAAALALSHKAELVTGDKDFRCVADQINILWL